MLTVGTIGGAGPQRSVGILRDVNKSQKRCEPFHRPKPTELSIVMGKHSAIEPVGIPADKRVGYTTPTHPSFEGGFGS